MSLYLSSNVLTLHSPKTRSFRNCSASQFINQNQRFLPITASITPTVEPPSSFRGKNASEINVVVVGSTGYIGKFVVKELVSRGFNVIAIARERSGIRGRNRKEDTLTDLWRIWGCLLMLLSLASLAALVGLRIHGKLIMRPRRIVLLLGGNANSFLQEFGRTVQLLFKLQIM
ncbi:unnamed protein product, partial [Vitis vinifera]